MDKEGKVKRVEPKDLVFEGAEPIKGKLKPSPGVATEKLYDQEWQDALAHLQVVAVERRCSNKTVEVQTHHSPDIEHHTQAPHVHLAGISGSGCVKELRGNVDEGAAKGGHLGGIGS
ncbi:hypothetical protein E2C01_004251 [Portunus trituberculatus]|uniref:Uncharacterized protein n=1 Tax=Portunus trituberculatus TaxID=210409 RepID=A0A5B7CVV9_PORTR|nr:hypothetical protein [Portunus trituberculatus]